MYPLYQNQNAYFWEDGCGRRLLVWNGEHYNLGNALGIVFSKNVNFITENYFGKEGPGTPMETLHRNLQESMEEYENLSLIHIYAVPCTENPCLKYQHPAVRYTDG